jgi:hypothetical protein
MFRVVHPFVTTVDGDTYMDAIKNFVKLNHNLNVSELIMTDQNRYWKANINYRVNDIRNRVGINVTPLSDMMVPMHLRQLAVPTAMVGTANVVRPTSPMVVAPGVNHGMVSPVNVTNVGTAGVATRVMSPTLVSPMAPIVPNVYRDSNGREQRVVSSGTLSTPVFPMVINGRTI